MPDILYSTNNRMKLLINERFRKDVHYVWCGDCFDSTKVATYSAAALTAPSSDPCAIYRQYQTETQRMDRHSTKIPEQKLSLSTLAVKWRDDGEITDEEAEEIIYMMQNSEAAHWKPLLYVSPRAAVAARLQTVPVAKRASFGIEYILPDLRRNEFDIVEL